MVDSSAPLPQFDLDLSDADCTLEVSAYRAQKQIADDFSTQELDANDVLEVENAAARLDDAPKAHPGSSSISPMALDLPRQKFETVLVPRVPGDGAMWIPAVAGAFAAMGIIAVGALVMFLSRPVTNAHGRSTGSPRVVARGAEKELVVTASERDALVTQSTRDIAQPSGPQTGVLRVPSTVRGMLVDGRPRKVNGSTILTCGKHAIKTGTAPARTVDVPCGGTVSL